MTVLTTRILLIDDHPIVRTSINLWLQKLPGMQVIGEASTGWQGLRLARDLSPDLVILDFYLPDISGLEVTQRLVRTNPSLKILILSCETHDLAPIWLSAAGALGYLVKSASMTELANALQAILSNPQPPCENHNPSSLKKIPFENLSTREVEIMRMIIKGNTVSEIAKQLHLELKTVYTYRSDIFKKMQVKNDVALTLLALQQKIVVIEDCM